MKLAVEKNVLPTKSAINKFRPTGTNSMATAKGIFGHELDSGTLDGDNLLAVMVTTV